MEQVRDLEVRVAIVAVLDLAAFPEQGVGFVEQQNGAARLRRIEHATKIFSVSPMYLLTVAERSIR